jgi:hypothetical protein
MIECVCQTHKYRHILFTLFYLLIALNRNYWIKLDAKETIALMYKSAHNIEWCHERSTVFFHCLFLSFFSIHTTSFGPQTDWTKSKGIDQCNWCCGVEIRIMFLNWLWISLVCLRSYYVSKKNWKVYVYIILVFSSSPAFSSLFLFFISLMFITCKSHLWHNKLNEKKIWMCMCHIVDRLRQAWMWTR